MFIYREDVFLESAALWAETISPSFREKSKKFAEQAAAIVCLRVLGVPEGRIGEEDSGLVCKRKREGKVNGAAEEERSRKRHVSDVLQQTSEVAVVTNGDSHQEAPPPSQ